MLIGPEARDGETNLTSSVPATGSYPRRGSGHSARTWPDLIRAISMLSTPTLTIPAHGYGSEKMSGNIHQRLS
jgi:hypothetical protein